MAKYHWQQKTPSSLSKAETYLKHSLELEPNYADAHVGLATTYALFYYYANWSRAEAITSALPHIQRALTLAPNSPTALATKGMLLTLKSSDSEDPMSDIAEARDAFLRSLALEENATTHHWYSILLKQLGEKALVLKHMEHAIGLNPLSASLKRIFSHYLAINGKLDTAQQMYQRALSLDPSHDSNIIESTYIFRNTPSSVKELAKWQSNHSELFEYCASDTYCEQVVFSYLSIGQDKEANKILARMRSKHRHFVDSLTLIDYGLNGETNSAMVLLEQLSQKHPNSYRYHNSLIHAQYRAGMYDQAKISMLKLYPEWQNDPVDNTIGVTTDNYLALILYGATLLHLNQQGYANHILNSVEQFLVLKTVQDKAQTEMALAQVNAQLNQPSKAIKHVRKALNLGWLETFDREWWTLQDSHLLKPIQNQTEFKMLVQKHQENVQALATQISDSLESLNFDT
jgi:tetratricopeptide (TPR) repeat protein